MNAAFIQSKSGLAVAREDEEQDRGGQDCEAEGHDGHPPGARVPVRRDDEGDESAQDDASGLAAVPEGPADRTYQPVRRYERGRQPPAPRHPRRQAALTSLPARAIPRLLGSFGLPPSRPFLGHG